MKTLTKYQAEDGLEFTEAAECRKHEANLEEVKIIMSQLPVRPDGCDFDNGGGFIQHDKDVLIAVRARFCEFAKRYTDDKWLQQTIDLGLDAHPSYVGRLIDDCAPNSIGKHWHRFMCIDSQFREWGQPYYANHPEKGEQKMMGMKL